MQTLQDHYTLNMHKNVLTHAPKELAHATLIFQLMDFANDGHVFTVHIYIYTWHD